MSEGQSQADSPLHSERGRTRIKESVVTRIAGLAAREVEGVHMGSGAARAAKGFAGRAPGVSGDTDPTRGVSAEVGEFETAIDLKMDVEYGRNIVETIEEVRGRIQQQIQYMTGLRITELNATVGDVVPPSGIERRGSSGGYAADSGSQGITDSMPNARVVRGSEIRPGIREEGTVEVEPRERTHTDLSGEPAREEVRVEGRSVEQGEKVELRPGSDEATTRGAGSETETREVEARETETRPARDRGTGGARPTSGNAGTSSFETRSPEARSASEDEEPPPRARRRRPER